MDIVDPKKPIAKGILDVGGEPTSVIVKDGYALTTVNTSPSYVDPSGKLVVIDIATQSIVREIELGGQPDSIALSPDHTYAAIAVENERDEDLNDGQLPQLPAGFLVIMNVADADPAAWTTSNVSVTDLPNVLYPTDPEPEYVYINSNNVCVLTLQENNAIVLIDLPTATVMASYSAGSVNLTQIDVDEDGIISPTGNQTHRLREPDSVVWIGDGHFAIANEGDLDGGSRGFTIFNDQGQIVYESYNTLEQEILRIGQYPEGRSENKGVEPEGLVYAVYGGSSNYLFITSERSSVVMVYDVSDVTNPVFKQVLPTNGGPEGIYAIPQRNLFIAACENDDRGNALRAGISIFELQDAPAAYPTMVSVNRVDGTPIPFSALSGLAAKMPRNYGSDAVEDSPILYTVEDSYFKQNRVLTIDTSDFPYHIVAEARIMDTNNVFADVLASAGLDASSIINADKTINVDLEGISVSHNGGFWVVHEGAGSVNDSTRPVVTPNILFKLSENVVIEQVVLLPSDVNDKQIRFGFEGCAEYGDEVVVAFQRAWVGEANPRIGIYNQNTTTWKFVFYPLDAPESQNGGWVGLSDVSSIGGGEFMFVERDNQGKFIRCNIRIVDRVLAAMFAIKTHAIFLLLLACVNRRRTRCRNQAPVHSGLERRTGRCQHQQDSVP